MSHSVVVALIILALASKELQTSDVTEKNKHLVSMQHFTKGTSGPRDHICSGVLLTRRVVLTACSCITKVHEDPTSSKKSAILMDPKRVVVYIGTSMDTGSKAKTPDSEVQRVETMFIHPLCDSEYSNDFAMVITRNYFAIKGLVVVKTLHRPDTIREFVVGTLDFPRACSTFSWLTDNSTAPCVNLEFNKKHVVSEDDLLDDILQKEKMRKLHSSPGYRNKRKAMNGGYEVVLRTLPTKYFAKNRIDVDFVEKNHCTSLVSVCALNPHGCFSGIHGLRCGEWCMRSLDCTERLCQIDTGSPVFCNKVLVGIVTRTRVFNCEGTNQVMAVVAGFDSALQFVKVSLASYKEKVHAVRKGIACPRTSGFPIMILLANILIHQI